MYVLGLVKLSVEPGTMAVISTRTNGFESIKSNQKAVVWDVRHVFPFNFEVISFSTDFQTLDFKFKDFLPQALSLASLVEEDASVFSYHLEGSLRFRLREEALISELERGTLKVNGLHAYYSGQQSQITSMLTEVVNNSMEKIANLSQNSESFSQITLSFLSKAMPYLEFEAVTFTALELPNLSLYRTAMDNLLSKTETSLKAQQQLAIKTEQSQLEHQQRQQIMREYGQILTDYPILIPYFALMQGADLPVDLSDFMPDFNQLFLKPPVTTDVMSNSE